MKNLRRTSRRHQAYNSEIYYEYPPGARVMTSEGFLGTVTAVEDGPFAGDEQYVVELDHGMGGGEYQSSELSAPEGTPGRTASLTKTADEDQCPYCSGDSLPINGTEYNCLDCHRIWDIRSPEAVAFHEGDGTLASEASTTAAIPLVCDGCGDTYFTDGEGHGCEGSLHDHWTAATEHVASEDYPELVDILVERPPLAHSTTASLRATAGSIPALPEGAILQQFSQYPQSGSGITYFRGEISADLWVDCLLSYKDGRLVGVLNHYPQDMGPERKGNVLLMVHPDYRMQGIGRALWEEAKSRWGVTAAGQDQTPDGSAFTQRVGHIQALAGFWDTVLEPVADKMLKAQEESGYGSYNAETGAAYSVDWCRFRHNRRCFFPKQLDDKGSAEAGYAVYLPEDRGLCPRDKWVDQKACPAPSEPGPKSGERNWKWETYKSWAQGGQGRYGSKSLTEIGMPSMPVTAARTDLSVEDLTKKVPIEPPEQVEYRQTLDEVVQERKQQKQNPYSGGNPYMSSADPEMGFHLTATWRDVQAKAKRIREGGLVRVISASPEYLVGEIQGDKNIYQATLMREPGTQKVALWECFLPEAPVTMSDGTEKPISQIKVGDLVLTHEGRTQRVVRAEPRPYSGEVARIRFAGDYREFVATGDHEVLSACSDRNPGWTKASDLHPGDHLTRTQSLDESPLIVTIPRPARRPVTSASGVRGVSEYRRNDYSRWAFKVQQGGREGIPVTSYFDTFEGAAEASHAYYAEHDSVEVKVDEEIARLLGWYVAEGFARPDGQGYEVGFTLADYETESIAWISEVCLRRFGATVRVRQTGPHKMDLRVANWTLHGLVTRLAGRGSKTKALAETVLTLPLPEQREFIAGWLMGDGCVEESGRHTISSSSETLLRQGRDILARLGHASRLRMQDTNPGGLFTTKNAGPIWHLRWTPGSVRTDLTIEDGIEFARIKQVDIESYTGEVWDIEVEGDHSFRAYGVNVHNCGCAWASYSWGRSGRWKKYEGRLCSHALALNYEGQSRGWGGGNVKEDRKAPSWRADQQVKVPGDYVKPEIGQWRKAGLVTNATLHYARVNGGFPTIEAAAIWMNAEAQKYESRVTPILQRAARDSLGEMKGLDHRFKTVDSLVRKLKGKGVDPRMITEPFKTIKDALRYTVAFPEPDWGNSVQEALWEIQGAGFRITEEENSWARGDSYSGLHYNLQPNGSDLVFELQFHTTASFTLKDQVLHRMYEEFRDKSTSLPRRQFLHDEMTKHWDNIPVPEDSLAFPDEKHFLRPVASLEGTARVASNDPSLALAPVEAIVADMRADGDSPQEIAATLASLGVEAAMSDWVGPYDLTTVKDLKVGDHLWAQHDAVGAGHAVPVTVTSNGPAGVTIRSDHSGGTHTITDEQLVYDWDLRLMDEVDYRAASKTARVKPFKGLVRGQVVDIIDVADGTVETASGPVSASDVLYPTYHPTRGLTASRTAEMIDIGGGRDHEWGDIPAGGGLWGDDSFMFARAGEDPERFAQHDRVERIDIGEGRDTEWGHLPFGGGDFDFMRSGSVADNVADQFAFEGELHDEPEPALPVTTADEEPEQHRSFMETFVQDTDLGPTSKVSSEFDWIPDAMAGRTTAATDDDLDSGDEKMLEGVEDFVPGDARLAHLMAGSPAKKGSDDMKIADAAREMLLKDPEIQKSALKAFSPAEQKQIIDEGEDIGAVAANLASLDIAGTHYAPLEAAFKEAEAEGDLGDDESWLY